MTDAKESYDEKKPLVQKQENAAKAAESAAKDAVEAAESAQEASDKAAEKHEAAKEAVEEAASEPAAEPAPKEEAPPAGASLWQVGKRAKGLKQAPLLKAVRKA